MELCLGTLHLCWSALLRIVVALVLLYMQLGPSSFAALAALLLLIPLQTSLVMRSARAQKRGLQHTDERVRALSEAVGAITTLKCYAYAALLRALMGGMGEGRRTRCPAGKGRARAPCASPRRGRCGRCLARAARPLTAAPCRPLPPRCAPPLCAATRLVSAAGRALPSLVCWRAASLSSAGCACASS